jgi:hypothetical protein
MIILVCRLQEAYSEITADIVLSKEMMMPKLLAHWVELTQQAKLSPQRGVYLLSMMLKL